MNYIFDIVVVGIIILGIVIGRKKGLVKSLIDLAGIVLALVITYSFVNPLGNFVCDKFVAPGMAESALKTVDVNGDIDLGNIIDFSGNNLIGGLLEKFNINTQEYKTFAEETKNMEKDERNLAIAEKIVRPAAFSISYAIAFIILFVVSMVVIGFVSRLSKIINKIPLIGGFNKAGGMLLGLAGGIIAVFVFANVIKAMSYTSFNKPDSLLNEKNIQNTMVFKYVYNLDVFDYILNFKK